MIRKDDVVEIVSKEIEDTEIILVDVQVSTSNQIKVQLDGFEGVTIGKCVEISRLIEGSFDREVEDYELEVSSYGIGQPFLLPLHYLKNINRDVEVYCKNGKNYKAILQKVELTEDKENVKFIELMMKKKIKPEGKKRKVEIEEIVNVAGEEIQKVKLVPVF